MKTPRTPSNVAHDPQVGDRYVYLTIADRYDEVLAVGAGTVFVRKHLRGDVADVEMPMGFWTFGNAAGFVPVGAQ